MSKRVWACTPISIYETYTGEVFEIDRVITGVYILTYHSFHLT